MAKYDEFDFTNAAQGAGLEELASRSFKKRYPGQSSPLPSDSASEDNKKRQDEEAKNLAKKVAKGIIAGPAGVAAEETVRRMKPYAKGGKVSSASKRADGCAIKGKTRGRMI